MGRDKVPKPAAVPVEAKSDVIIGLDGKPQRPPRGQCWILNLGLGLGLGSEKLSMCLK